MFTYFFLDWNSLRCKACKNCKEQAAMSEGKRHRRQQKGKENSEAIAAGRVQPHRTRITVQRSCERKRSEDEPVRRVIKV